MNDKLFYIGVKGVIRNERDEILLLRADISKHRGNISPYWDIPGGRIEVGANALTTLKREVREETGVDLIGKPELLTTVISNHQVPFEDGTKIGLALMVYKAQIPESSKIKISKEHVAYEWVSKTEAKKRLTHKYPKEFTSQL